MYVYVPCMCLVSLTRYPGLELHTVVNLLGIEPSPQEQLVMLTAKPSPPAWGLGILTIISWAIYIQIYREGISHCASFLQAQSDIQMVSSLFLI